MCWRACPSGRTPATPWSSRRDRAEADLPAKPRVGTGSLRRQFQAEEAFPAWDVRGLRGNVDTRLRKVDSGELDAVILAAAGLNRLGHGGRITRLFTRDEMVPAVGQGAIALEARRDHDALLALLETMQDARARREIDAERRFLMGLGGSCTTPLGIHAEMIGEKVLLRGFLSSVDGTRRIRDRVEGPAAEAPTARRRAPRAVLESGRRRAPGQRVRSLREEAGAMVGLRGRRILITRARAQGEKLAAAIEELGGKAVWVPAIQTLPIPLDEAGRAHPAGPRPVPVGGLHERKRGEVLLRPPGGRRAWSCPSTCASPPWDPPRPSTSLARGLKVEAQPETYTGLDLAELLVSAHVRGPLLLPRGAAGREELADRLAEAGWEVTPLTVYETRPAVITPDHVWAIEQGVDAALFASPSAVKALWEALPETARAVLRRAVCQPIGPTTARALEEVGLVPAPLPEKSTAEGLVKAIVDRLG